MQLQKKLTLMLGAAAISNVLSPFVMAEITVPLPTKRPATALKTVAHAALTDVTNTGKRLVGIGERGVIIYSDDHGLNWLQAQVPVSVTLTSVRFVDENQGWATGHAGTVLHTSDGGKTWFKQLDGDAIISLITGSVESFDEKESDSSLRRKAKATARQFAEDGPDKPLLDLYFSDQLHGIVVGAYGLALVTSNGGKSWVPILDRLDNPKSLHLNCISGIGSTIVIAGEQGLLFRSTDRGHRFERIQTEYRGSFFSINAIDERNLVLGGMRGSAFRSFDGGISWEKMHVGTPATIVAITATSDKKIMIADQTGQLFEGADHGKIFVRRNVPNGLPLSSITRTESGDYIAVGLRGLTKVALSETPRVSPRSTSEHNK
jgi:photosystem II stability/assembly factor-like uncharacterized protein